MMMTGMVTLDMLIDEGMNLKITALKGLYDLINPTNATHIPGRI